MEKILKLRCCRKNTIEIIEGRKTVEYRNYSDFYVNKLAILPATDKKFVPKPYKILHLFCGNVKDSLFVTCEIKSINLDSYNYFIKNKITPPDGMSEKNLVFSIEIEKIIQTNYLK